MLCLVKGSPEAIGPLLRPSSDAARAGLIGTLTTYTALAEQGLRVLALAYKRCGGERSFYARRRRCRQEASGSKSGLTFGGFIAFGCGAQGLGVRDPLWGSRGATRRSASRATRRSPHSTSLTRFGISAHRPRPKPKPRPRPQLFQTLTECQVGT